MDLKIRDFQGKNLRFRLEPLKNDIDVADCKIQIKSNSITLTLKKRDTLAYWSDILAKPTDKKSAKKMTADKDVESSDPNANLMNLMKDLYDGGDDNMKRTIAESWSKAHETK